MEQIQLNSDFLFNSGFLGPHTFEKFIAFSWSVGKTETRLSIPTYALNAMSISDWPERFM